MLIAFVCVLAFAYAQAQSVTGPRVNTTEGVVEGLNVTHDSYMAFFGIPYAGPTSGNNRFKAPPPPDARPGVFSATDNTIVCAQLSQNSELIGVEDCLRLSIYTNDLSTPKPVLIFLHGEEYTTVPNLPYSYKKLVHEGIVFVTMNYRLSVFGFLCLGVEEAPGNAGLKDIVQGLKWIKENIAGFGGDPNKVTLFGHGSAAAMVDLITMSPLANGLVHNAIALSGSALAPWAVAYDPIGYAQILANRLSYGGKSVKELAKHLVNADISLLRGAILNYDFYNNTPNFAPCIENVNLNPNDTFLADAPIKILQSGKYSHIPYLAGYTDREGTMRAEKAVFKEWQKKMQENLVPFLPVDLDLQNNVTAVESAVREFYFPKNITSDIEDFLTYQGDILVLVSVIRGARERALTSTAEVRLFEFAYQGTYNSDWAYPTIPIRGVKHGGVLNYLFDYDLKPVDHNAQKALITRFKAFTYNGSPEAVNYTNWLPLSKTLLNYMYYSGGEGPNPDTAVFVERAMGNPHSQRMTLWNDLYSKYYIAPTQVSSAGKLLSLSIIVLLCQLFVRLL